MSAADDIIVINIHLKHNMVGVKAIRQPKWRLSLEKYCLFLLALLMMKTKKKKINHNHGYRKYQASFVGVLTLKKMVVCGNINAFSKLMGRECQILQL